MRIVSLFFVLSSKFCKILSDKDGLGEKERAYPVNPHWRWESNDFATVNRLQIFEIAETKNSAFEFAVFLAWTVNTFEIREPWP